MGYEGGVTRDDAEQYSWSLKAAGTFRCEGGCANIDSPEENRVSPKKMARVL